MAMFLFLAARKLLSGLDVAAGRGLLLKPVRAIAAEARARGLVTAVATGAERAVVEAGMARTGMRALFDVVVTVEDAGVGKPDPAIFLVAAATLVVDRRGCLAFEDSDIGVRAALAAGMDVVNVRPPLTYATPDAGH